MNIGDRVKTPFGEYGLIIRKAEPPNDWVIENAEDDDVYESYPEALLVLVPRKNLDIGRDTCIWHPR
jgi:hypothetical protein